MAKKTEKAADAKAKDDKAKTPAAPKAAVKMTTKTTKQPSVKSKAASVPKAPKKTTAKKGPKAAPKPQGPRHPRARVLAAHGGKEALAKSLASTLAVGDESADAVADRLKTASNAQLLRLASLAETVKSKWGSRDKLIEAISTAEKKSKDKDYLTKLGTYSLPQLIDLERRTHA